MALSTLEHMAQSTNEMTVAPGHISPEQFKKGLSEEALRHLAVCPRCRESLAGEVESEELLAAPRHLKASVLERSRKLDVQIIAGSNHLSKKLRLFYFSLKVGVAVACSLSLLFMTPGLVKNASAQRPEGGNPNQRMEQLSPKRWKYYEHVEQLTNQLNQLSNFNLEVFRYDKKER